VKETCKKFDIGEKMWIQHGKRKRKSMNLVNTELCVGFCLSDCYI